MSSLAYLTVFSLMALAVAATPPSPASATVTAPPPRRAPRGPATTAQFLSLINAARADAGAPPMSWNTTIAWHAKLHVSWLRDSAGCDLNQASRDPIRLEAGDARFRGYGHPSPADAVASWLKERPWYDRTTGACIASKVCGSYKIIVTPKLRQLGCALVACPSGGGVAACAYGRGPGTKGPNR
ncbi:unnamed protein product [Urochloa humidicola]